VEQPTSVSARKAAAAILIIGMIIDISPREVKDG
jgi:hypothetical protein